MFKIILKVVIVVAGLIMFAIIAFYVYLFIASLAMFGLFDKSYSNSELKEIFYKNKKEIYDLKKYFNQIVPKNTFVEIEFDSDTKLTRFGFHTLDSNGNTNYPIFLDWDLQINTHQMDSLIQPLGWNRNTLQIIKNKLDKANCIQIESGEPAYIGFQRSGLGMYTFIVYDKPMHDTIKKTYLNRNDYDIIDSILVVKYESGAL